MEPRCHPSNGDNGDAADAAADDEDDADDDDDDDEAEYLPSQISLIAVRSSYWPDTSSMTLMESHGVGDVDDVDEAGDNEARHLPWRTAP